MIQYRLLEVSTTYEAYLNFFYEKNRDVDSLSYEELYSLFVEDYFAESDFLHRHLRKIGVESKVVFYNNLKLQRKWKEEFADYEPFEILMNQIRDYQPDVIYITDMTALSREQLLQIKNYRDGKRVRLVGFCFFLLTDKSVTAVRDLFDQIYTGAQYYVDMYRKSGANAKLLRHAFEPAVYEKFVSGGDRKNEVVFLGNVFLGKDIHSNRIDMLKALIDCKVPYSFYGEIYGTENRKSLLERIKNRVYSSKELRTIRFIMDENRQNHYPNVYGRDYYRILSEKLICINRHISAIGRGAGNMRMYEATGMGTCLLTDTRDENVALFEIDKEIVTYSNLDEFQDKVKWLTRNPQKAEEIAKAGQKKTFQVHSYKNKALQINEYLQELF